jgi:hypothetical protein
MLRVPFKSYILNSLDIRKPELLSKASWFPLFNGYERSRILPNHHQSYVFLVYLESHRLRASVGLGENHSTCEHYMLKHPTNRLSATNAGGVA